MSNAGRPKNYNAEEEYLLLKKKSLARYSEIINTYKRAFKDYIEEAEVIENDDNIFSEREMPDKRKVLLAERLLELPEWKLNYFILWLYYQRHTTIMSNELKIDRNELQKLTKEIKQEIKWK